MPPQSTASCLPFRPSRFHISISLLLSTPSTYLTVTTDHGHDDLPYFIITGNMDLSVLLAHLLNNSAAAPSLLQPKVHSAVTLLLSTPAVPYT